VEKGALETIFLEKKEQMITSSKKNIFGTRKQKQKSLSLLRITCELGYPGGGRY